MSMCCWITALHEAKQYCSQELPLARKDTRIGTSNTEVADCAEMEAHDQIQDQAAASMLACIQIEKIESGLQLVGKRRVSHNLSVMPMLQSSRQVLSSLYFPENMTTVLLA